MNSISIAVAGDAEPLPICRSYREWLVGRYKGEASIALKFFSDELPIAEGDKGTDEKAINHVRKCPKCPKCPKCREWIHKIVPPDILRRQRRFTHYCCAGMFVAVEEANGKSRNQVTFEMFRGEDPCWKIDGIRTFASYCPWCGKKLPDKPFIPEE